MAQTNKNRVYLNSFFCYNDYGDSMKNNKGFTLIELISIMVILGILALIAIPSISKHVNESREVAYKEQVERIVSATKKYVIESDEFLYSEKDKIQITLLELKKNGYLENEDLYNPITEKELNGCVNVEYNNSQGTYSYSYVEVCS